MAGYDAIVLGVGGVGGAALYHLRTGRDRVLGIDRFAGARSRKLARRNANHSPGLFRAHRLRSAAAEGLRAFGRLAAASCAIRSIIRRGCCEWGRPAGEVIHGVRAQRPPDTRWRSRIFRPAKCMRN